MSKARGLYKELLANRPALVCEWKDILSYAIEYALTNMRHNGSRCEIGGGYHVFMFDDGSALKLDAEGIQMRE